MCSLTEGVVFRSIRSLEYAPDASIFTKIQAELAARVLILFASAFSAVDGFVQLLAFGGKGMYWLASKISCGHLAPSSGKVVLEHLGSAFVCAGLAYLLPHIGVISPFEVVQQEHKFYKNLFFLTPPAPPPPTLRLVPVELLRNRPRNQRPAHNLDS